MNTVRDLRLIPVWVNPAHLVSTAGHVMRGHNVTVLGVVEEGKLVGVIHLEDVITAKEGTAVSEIMRQVGATIEADANVRAAAQRLVAEQLDSAPVIDGGGFIGMITPLMLLKELGQSYDPLTSLSWSDSLREWGVRHLQDSEEVTIIFIDLNHFGIYNKKYGHIIGDRVISKVASFLAGQIDRDLDILVRYGGDEFAIGTLRDRDESEAFAELLEKRFDGKMEGADEPVGFTTGVFGGRRHKERESVHYAATIDNLINIASKNCMAKKKRLRGEEAPSQPEEISFRVLGIYADEEDGDGIVTVVLTSGGTVYSGAESRNGRSIVDAIASATGKAVSHARPGNQLAIHAIDLMQEGDSQVVSVTGFLRSGEGEKPVASATRVKGDLANAVVEATIEAFAS
jgi:GGDEF domain-containing protein